MLWDLDNSDIPVKKPKEITQLEAMGKTSRDSMPPVEMDEKMEEAAIAVAKNYKKILNSNYSGCVTVVTVALEVTGSSLGGKFGSHMLSHSQPEAEKACKLIFEEEFE